MPRRKTSYCVALILAGGVTTARAQVSLTGSSLALKSSGSASLSSTGYVGTYLTVPAGGATVNFTVSANSVSGSGTAPHMNLVIADSVTGFSVASTSSTAYTTPNVTLPAGTYLVRAERDYSANAGVTRSLTVGNLSVNTVAGSGTATFSNVSTDTNALAAADTYINNFRKGAATVALTGPGGVPLLPGTPVHVDLARHTFNFGTEVPGNTSSDVNSYLGSTSTSLQTSYQAKLNQNFNMIVPGNAGKWGNNEATRDFVTMSNVDTILNYAQAHNMRARMHNLLWGDNTFNGQQPSWVLNNSGNGLLDQAKAGNATAAADLRTEISERIQYYVGTGTAADRAKKYAELDVYNESFHTPTYTQAYGYSGIASIYNEAAAAGAKTYTNEYNVLQDGTDAFANWYVGEIESIRRAGGNVGGIGVQYYANSTIGPNNNQHSPARIYAAFQNLSAQGLPITLTEFGVKAGGEAVAPQVLGDSMRLTFGTPGATGFLMWGFYAGEGLFAPAAALFDNNFNVTDAGKRWQDLLGVRDWDGNPTNAWDTNLDATVSSDGTISFTGFYGDYYLRGQAAGAYDLTLVKGTTSYAAALSLPPTWSTWNPAVSGAWSQAGNWTAGGGPNAVGSTAYFGPAGGARAVTLGSDQVVGMVVLNSPAGAYTIGGTGLLTLSGFNTAGGHAAVIRVVAGSHTIAAQVVLADATTIDLASPSSALTISNLQPSPTVAVTKSGPGELRVNALGVASLTIAQGVVRLTGGAAASSSAGSLTISPGGSLDVANGQFTIDLPAAGSLPTVADFVRQFLADRRLFSAAADGDPQHVRALGYAPSAATDLLVRFTYLGDANLDGRLDADDYALIDRAFAKSLPNAHWVDGDFNYDGAITSADYLQIDRSFALLSGGLSPSVVAEREAQFGPAYVFELMASIPEPAIGSLLTVAIPALFVCRRPPGHTKFHQP